jgi:hypothetical protein
LYKGRDCPSSKGDISKRVKIYRKLKKIFTRTRRPNSIKLGTIDTWVKRIQVCSNEGPCSLQKGR